VVGHNAGNLVFALSAVFDGLVVCGAVAWATRGKPLAGRLVLALGLAVAILAVKGVLLLAAGVAIPFGVLHVVWLDLVVVAPLAALLLLLLTRDQPARATRLGAAFVLLLAPVGAYASFVEPERLEVERAELSLPAAREGSEPLRIGVIADLQFEHLGGHEHEAVERLVGERPDVILLAGDYHQGSHRVLREELPRLRSLLRKLRAPGGVYAVQGDAESVREARLVTAGTGVRLLLDGMGRTRVRDRPLTIGGVELRYRSPDARRLVRRLERDPGDGDVRILLAHRPDVVLGLRKRTRIDLVVAGHTHGGQLQLPLLGPPTISSHVPRRVGAGGLHTVGGRDIYVSRGVGVERGQAPKLRLGAPPEVSLITLR
jgi:uncharacterized protein